MTAVLPLAIPFCLIWSSAFAAAKFGLDVSPPLLFLGVRFLLAGSILTLIAAARGQLRGITLQQIGWVAVLGVLNNGLYLGLSYTAMTKLSAGLSSIIMSCVPVVTAVLAPPVLGEKMRMRVMIGLALGVIGVSVVVRQRIGGGIDDDPLSLTLSFVALFSLAGGTLLFKRVKLGLPLMATSGLQVLAAGLAVMPVGLLTERVADIHLTLEYTLAMAYLVGPVSIGAYLLWFAMLQRGSTAAASVWHFAMPPLGVLFGWALLHEPVEVSDLLGIVPVAIAIFLVTKTA